MGIAEHLGEWFGALAADWRGWDGQRTWHSIEGTLRLTATHDGLGTVLLYVHLKRSTCEADWAIDGPVWLDAGALPAVARAARAFSER